MIENIPLPRLLNASGGTERRIHPINVSVNLEITPLSYASMTLPKGENLPARGYVELYTCMGSAGIYRVRSPQDAYGSEITTAELEHAVVEVGDYLISHEYDEMMAANTAMTTVFSYYRGSKWQLGSVSALGSGQIALEAKYVRVLEAMLAILEQKPDCMMAFDFSTSPWTINIVNKGTTVAAEGRLARNVNYARVTYDDTELCTRAYYEKEATTDEAPSYYPVFDQTKNYSKNEYVRDNATNNKLYQLPSGHTAGTTWANTTKTSVTNIPTSVWAYVDADTIGTYGVIEREVQTGSNYTASEALYAAQEYLRTHKNPRISVEISLEELSSITGETLDTFTIGKLCRLALVDYNVTVEKNIISLSFPNVYRTPRSVTATLADAEDTTINFLHDVDSKGGSGGGGGGSKKQDDQWKEYRTIFEQDDYHFGLYAQRLNTANEILQQAGLYIDSNGVLVFAEDNERMIGSKLTVQADKIAMVVGTNQDGNYIKVAEIAVAINDAGEGVVLINADHVNISATNTAYTLAGQLEVDSQGRLVIKNAGGMYVKKTEQGVTSYFGVWNDGNVTGLTVSRLINGDSSATINASKIYLLGETIANTITADYINGKIATIPTLSGISASFSGNVTAVGGVTGSGIYYTGGSGTQSLHSAVKLLQITGPDSNNMYTLQCQKFNGSGWENVGSFERGDTDAAYNQGWNDCIDAALQNGHTCLTGYTNYNNASSTSLYYYDTSSLSYKVATGSAKVWRYGGGTHTYYSLPDRK